MYGFAPKNTQNSRRINLLNIGVSLGFEREERERRAEEENWRRGQKKGTEEVDWRSGLKKWTEEVD